MFSLLWHSFTVCETHPMQTTCTIQPPACNRTQLLAVTLSNTAYTSRTSRGEFHSGQHNFPVPQVSPLPSDRHICLLEDTDVKLQECILQETVNCKLASSRRSYSLSQILSCSALILSCSLVLFSTEQLQYFPLEMQYCFRGKVLCKKHLHCVLKFRPCGTALLSVTIWVLLKCMFVLREGLPILHPLFDVIRCVLQGISSRWY